MTNVIDSDQHLYEYRGLWAEHIDPAHRDDAIRFVDDALGHVRVLWRDRLLSVADVQMPGETDAIGERRRREASRRSRATTMHCPRTTGTPRRESSA